MSLIKKIKSQLGEWRLFTKMGIISSRVPQVMNIEDTKTIGILLDATNSEDFELIKKYVIYLKSLGKNVYCICFYDHKVDPNYQYPKSEFDFINLKSVDISLTPTSPYIKSFISEQKDLLIDANLKNIFTLRYIAALSNAKFKVGVDIPENKKIHDLLVSITPESGVKNFLKNVDVFLEKINRP